MDERTEGPILLLAARVLATTAAGHRELSNPQRGLSLPQRWLLGHLDGERDLAALSRLPGSPAPERLPRDAARLVRLQLAVDVGEVRPAPDDEALSTSFGDTTAGMPLDLAAEAPSPAAPGRVSAAQGRPRWLWAAAGSALAAAAGLAWIGLGSREPATRLAAQSAGVPAGVAAPTTAAAPVPAAAPIDAAAAPPSPPPAVQPAAVAATLQPAVAPAPAAPRPPTAEAPRPPATNPIGAALTPGPGAAPPAAAAPANTAARPPGVPAPAAAGPALPAALPAATPIAAPAAGGAPPAAGIGAAPAAPPPAVVAPVAAPAPAAAAVIAPPPPAAPPVAAAVPAETPLRPLATVQPEFPREGRGVGSGGVTVQARLSVAPDGSVAQVTFPRSTISTRPFERAARTALQQWRFPAGSGERFYLQSLQFSEE